MANILRSPNYREIRFTAPSGGKVSGEMYKVEDTVGVVFEDVAAAAEGVLVYHAERIIVPKATGGGTGFSVGDKVFYSDSTHNVTSTSGSGLFLIGVATQAATTSATTVEIDLDGAAVTAI